MWPVEQVAAGRSPQWPRVLTSNQTDLGVSNPLIPGTKIWHAASALWQESCKKPWHTLSLRLHLILFTLFVPVGLFPLMSLMIFLFSPFFFLFHISLFLLSIRTSLI